LLWVCFSTAPTQVLVLLDPERSTSSHLEPAALPAFLLKRVVKPSEDPFNDQNQEANEKTSPAKLQRPESIQTA